MFELGFGVVVTELGCIRRWCWVEIGDGVEVRPGWDFDWELELELSLGLGLGVGD